ncbi:MAG: hypothetical protein F4X98_14980 [Gammaproteobacteria bacterium]|nr:hypothetical protein [Gammaproteobacteria bacterium]
MVEGEHLPRSDHASRYLSSSRLVDGLPRATAFTRAEGDTCPISVNWLEQLKEPDRESEIGRVREALAPKLTMTKRGRIVVLNVGDAIAAVEDTSSCVISFVHEPEEGDDSHAGIHGYPDEDKEQELLISTTLKRLIAADDVYLALPSP